jgi:hypothetical protein
MDKKELLRIIRTPEGQVMVDRTGRADGRGAYLCQQATCLEKIFQHGRLSRALKTTVSANDMAELIQGMGIGDCEDIKIVNRQLKDYGVKL